MITARWIFAGNGPVRRLNLAYFVQLGAAIAPLTEFSFIKAPPAEKRAIAYRVRAPLHLLTQEDSMPLAIPASRPAAQHLKKTIEERFTKEEPSEDDAWDVYFAASRLQTLLGGELAVQSVYHIWPKRAFDTNRLIDSAISIFSKEIIAWFSAEEIYNISQAGKCLAFEVPTAAAFHLIRATESVIRRYYAIVIGQPPKQKMRNWGTYLINLKKCGADAKVIHALEQMKDLHRNPIIHPEDEVSLEDALSLLGITESVISAIYADMKNRAQSSLPLDDSGKDTLPATNYMLRGS